MLGFVSPDPLYEVNEEVRYFKVEAASRAQFIFKLARIQGNNWDGDQWLYYVSTEDEPVPQNQICYPADASMFEVTLHPTGGIIIDPKGFKENVHARSLAVYTAFLNNRQFVAVYFYDSDHLHANNVDMDKFDAELFHHKENVFVYLSGATLN